MKLVATIGSTAFIGAAMDGLIGTSIAKIEGAQNDAHGIAFAVPSSSTQLPQFPWPEFPAADTEIILSVCEPILAAMVLAWTADRVRLRLITSPRKRANSCRSGPSAIIDNHDNDASEGQAESQDRDVSNPAPVKVLS